MFTSESNGARAPTHRRHAALRTPSALFARWLLMLVLALVSGAAAAEATGAEEVADLHARLSALQDGLKAKGYDESQLRKWATEVQTLRSEAEHCIAGTEDAITRVNDNLDKLGPAADDNPALQRERADLQARKTQLGERLAGCRVVQLRSEALNQELDDILREEITRRLLAKSPSIWQQLRNTWEEPGSLATFLDAIQDPKIGLELLDGSAALELTAYLIVALLLGLYAGRRLRRRVRAPQADDAFLSRFGAALRVVSARYAVYLALASALAWYFYDAAAGTAPLPLLVRIAYALPVLVLVIGAIRLFLAPFPPAQPIHGLPPQAARALARRFSVLLVLAGIGYLLFSTLLAQAVPAHLLALARDLYFAAVVLNLIWIVWIVGSISTVRSNLAVRTLLTLTLLASVVAEWSGYDNLSMAIIRGLTGTLAALGAALLLTRLLRETVSSLDAGKYAWQQAVHRILGLEHGEHIPGLRSLSVLLMLGLWVFFLIVALRFWGLSESGLQRIGLWLRDGFAVGSVHVVPAKIALGLLGLALLLTFSGWVRKRLEKNWLPRTRLDRGAREATVAIVGYTSIALAVIVALVVAGFDFSNIAIIAGALSVGIGFGLQNIVNNFVSGLILLFERPVKTGDWVVVGSTEGYVKRISIRSTQIQTFDRADVIVPNSELISNQVTNWMLYDPRGRIRVPVGVAYGSDTALVKQILLEIANNHPQVVRDNSSPQPVVLFLGFGESSLDFELRCFVSNIDTRLTVISDMNFAIDAAFRAHQVEIPFPQRDLHVRDWPKERRPDGEPPT